MKDAVFDRPPSHQLPEETLHEAQRHPYAGACRREGGFQHRHCRYSGVGLWALNDAERFGRVSVASARPGKVIEASATRDMTPTLNEGFVADCDVGRTFRAFDGIILDAHWAPPMGLPTEGAPHDLTVRQDFVGGIGSRSHARANRF
jgi:hypothetical protein